MHPTNNTQQPGYLLARLKETVELLSEYARSDESRTFTDAEQEEFDAQLSALAGTVAHISIKQMLQVKQQRARDGLPPMLKVVK